MTQENGAESSPTPSNFYDGKSVETVEAAITGTNPHTFRVMQAQLDDTASHTSIRMEETPYRTVEELATLEPTFSQHQAVLGIPFTASYLSMDKVYKDADMATKQNVQAIEMFLERQIKSGKYIDSAKAVGKIIRDIETKLKLKEYHDPFYKANRIAQYIEAVDDFDSIAEVKENFSDTAKKQLGELTQKVNELLRRTDKKDQDK